MGEYVKNKKDMIFQSVDSLQQVVNVVNEASAALNDPKRTIHESAIPEVLTGALGAGIGSSISFIALYGLGKTGLSAPGITSALSQAGAILGKNKRMVKGIFVLSVPIVVFTVGGVCIAGHLKNKQLKQEKERLYTEALSKHEAIIKELEKNNQENAERLNYLQSLNILLQKAIEDLRRDLGVE